MSDQVNGAETGLRVIVVGAGIAGLAAAISLRRQGHSVEVCLCFANLFTI
jgi:monoamine oxidase